MALSTFRFFLAAAGASIPTPPSVDNYFFDTPAVLYDGHSNYGYNGLYLVPASSSTSCFAIFTDNAVNIRAMLVSTQTGGPSVSYAQSASLVAAANWVNGTTIIGDAISNSYFVVAYLNTSDEMTALYVNNSSGTLSTTNTYTSSTNTGGAPTSTNLSYITLDGTHGLLAAIGTSAQPIEMINPTVSTGQLYHASSGNWSSSIDNLYGIALTSSLAAYVWVNTSSQITIGTIDVSGSTFAVNSAVSNTGSTLVSSSTSVGVCLVSASKILLTYLKSSTTLAAIVVTIASGGSVSYGTEYTLAGNYLTNGTMQPVAVGSGQFLCGYITASPASGNNYGLYSALGIYISGSAITFSSSPANYISPFSLQANFSSANYSPYMCALNISSTKSLMGFIARTNTGTGFTKHFMPRIIPIEVGTAPMWSSSWSGNMQQASLGNITYTNPSYPSAIGDELFWAGANNSTSATTMYAIATDYDGRYSDFSASDSNSSVTQVSIANLPPTNSSTGNNRFFVTIINSTSLIVATQQINVSGTAGFSGFAGPTTVDTSVTNIRPGIGILASNLAISVYVKSAGLYAAIITSNGATTISSISTPTLIYSSASLTLCPINITVISSTLVLVTFQPGGSGAHTGYAMLLSISGGTITAGTAASLPTNPSSDVSSCYLTGSNGIITYTNNSTGNMNGVTYSYSGTTLTISSATAFSTSGTVAAIAAPAGQLVTLDSTHAMCLFYDSGTGNATATLLTSTGEGNFTAGTNYTNNISDSIVSVNLMQGSGSKLIGQLDTTGSVKYMMYLYRS